MVVSLANCGCVGGEGTGSFVPVQDHVLQHALEN